MSGDKPNRDAKDKVVADANIIKILSMLIQVFSTPESVRIADISAKLKIAIATIFAFTLISCFAIAKGLGEIVTTIIVALASFLAGFSMRSQD